MVQFFCLVLKLLNQFSLDVPVSQIYNHNLSFSHFCFALVPRAGESSFVQSSFYLMYLWYLLHPIKTYIRVFLDFVMIIFQLPSWPDLDMCFPVYGSLTVTKNRGFNFKCCRCLFFFFGPGSYVVFVKAFLFVTLDSLHEKNRRKKTRKKLTTSDSLILFIITAEILGER